MAGLDAKKIQAMVKGDKYVVLQATIAENAITLGGGVTCLSSLQRIINEQASRGYRLHTISTASVEAKSLGAGVASQMQATMIFEKI
ncbi:MAG: DUF4177 domain-containing protein [Firmicutes bacterium]|nr:DUF4177 domain-containing protein [Bacillota bacterium]